ncbi:hypothetical protein V4C53_43965 [Paraburkholderia azotifigens]|uniref:hypothetical protein n=1 Tax=Paraburkholderia azotifigens TaxID=2057004 RepID=UPI003180A4DF
MKKEGPRISGVTLASDSRISWNNQYPRDDCTKIYAATGQPEIAGFVGDVDLAQQVVSSFLAEALHTGAEFDPYARCGRLATLLKARRTELAVSCRDTTILYAARSGMGMKRSVFHLWALSWIESDSELHITHIPIDPTEPSAVVTVDGSGQTSVRHWQHEWCKKTPDRHFTRHFFSAFCDSIFSGDDEFSGGVPQVAVVRRTKAGQLIGFVNKSGPFLKGRPLETPPAPDLQFVNEDYQFVDEHGNRKGKPRIRPHEAPTRAL